MNLNGMDSSNESNDLKSRNSTTQIHKRGVRQKTKISTIDTFSLASDQVAVTAVIAQPLLAPAISALHSEYKQGLACSLG